MEKNDFLKKMEELKKPNVVADASRRQVKITIMSAQKSAFWGMWFLIVPLVFFACVVIKELLHLNWGIAGGFLDKIAELDRSASTKWVTPVMFILLPKVCALLNLLAIMHFSYDKAARELLVAIKIRWINIILAVVSLAFIAMVLLYGIMETAAERALLR